MTVGALIEKCVSILLEAGIKSPLTDVEWLASETLQYRRSELALYSHKIPTSEQVNRILKNINRRMNREPFRVAGAVQDGQRRGGGANARREKRPAVHRLRRR